MKLSLLSRLFLGYCFLLVLAAGMSVYAIVQLGRVTDVTRSIILADNSLISLQKDMTDALLSETRYEKKYLIIQDRALFDGFLKSTRDFEQYLQEASQLRVSEEEKAVLVTVAKMHQTYQHLFEEELAFLKAGQKYSRSRYGQAKDRAVNAAIEELIRLRLMAQKNIFDKIKNLSEAGTRARTIAMIVSAVSLAFGIVLAVWTTRSITRPLAEMQKKTREISEGIFNADLDLPSPPEIGELAKAINTMCSKLREVDKMKMDFFALMSHELRTPLTSIKEGTNLFLEGKGGEVTEKQKKLLTIMSEESDRLIELVNSVLDLSKLESGLLAFNFTTEELGPLITRVVHEVRPLAEAKHIKINQDVAELPAIFMDSERMLQVLRNLISNALKFTPSGGMVSITARSAEQVVTVAVSDTGPGIPQEQAAVIFDKFRQGPGPGKFPGTGLGLAIVKHIIQSHGGSVWVQSNEGCGSTFTVQLPA